MTHSVFNKNAIPSMRELIAQIETPSVVDFDEQIQLQSIQENLRLWYQAETLTAFAYVDTYNNLRFEVDPKHSSERIGKEIVEWGVQCMQERNAQRGNTKMQSNETLDASCLAQDTKRVNLLEQHGFKPESTRSFTYARSLSDPIVDSTLPPDFTLMHVTGEEQVEALVSLHRAAFGTDNMTVEERLAMMRVSNYEKELDLLVLSPSGEFAGCCICEIDEDNAAKGWTDPIAVHPTYQGQGIGKALLAEGLNALKHRNISTAMLGTSNQNKAMMRLAESSGFEVVSEKLWFAKTV